MRAGRSVWRRGPANKKILYLQLMTATSGRGEDVQSLCTSEEFSCICTISIYAFYTNISAVHSKTGLLHRRPSSRRWEKTSSMHRVRSHAEGSRWAGMIPTAFLMQTSISLGCGTTNISKHTNVYSLWHSVSAGCRSSCYFPGREKKQTAVIFKGKDWKRKACVQSPRFWGFWKCCWGDAFS